MPTRQLPNVLVLLIISLIFLFFLVPGQSKATGTKNHFPLFKSISDNVSFWENIYAKYPSNTAVLHDREDLSIIYTITPVLDSGLPGFSQLNRAYLKTIKDKYSSLLLALAAGKAPETGEEMRIHAMFSPPDVQAKLEAAAENIRVQTGLKKRFIEGVIRSGAHMAEMKHIFRSYGLPEDLAYLPHVESSFNPKAYSKRGAAGIWQFTRSTGKNYMTIDHVLDERLDIITATHAAARHLKRNFEKLGTWPLAITAYNYGRSGTMRALKQEGSYENIFNNYREGHFGFASRNFYAEFLAALKVAKRLENADFIQQAVPKTYAKLTLPGYIPAADLLHHFRLSERIVRELNPSLRKSVWQGEKYIPKGYSLFLPNNSRITSLSKNLPADLLRNQQKKAPLYTVKRGDTASEIAQKFNVSLASLRRANNLNKKASVFVGQKLRIPSLLDNKIRPEVVRDKFESSSQGKSTIPVLREKKKETAG